MFGKQAAIFITSEVTYGVRIQERRMDLLTKEIDSVDGQEVGTGIRGFSRKGERGLRKEVKAEQLRVSAINGLCVQLIQ